MQEYVPQFFHPFKNNMNILNNKPHESHSLISGGHEILRYYNPYQAQFSGEISPKRIPRISTSTLILPNMGSIRMIPNHMVGTEVGPKIYISNGPFVPSWKLTLYEPRKITGRILFIESWLFNDGILLSWSTIIPTQLLGWYTLNNQGP